MNGHLRTLHAYREYCAAPPVRRERSERVCANQRSLRSRRTANTRSRAFTLLEIIVAMTIVAIMTLSMYASIRIAFNAQKSATNATAPARSMGIALDLLALDLQNVMPPGQNSAESSDATLSGTLAGAFTGTDGSDDRGHDGDDVVFFSTADAADHVDGNGEIKQIELHVITDPTTGDHLLVRDVTRNLLTSIPPNPDEEVLCRGVNAFNLRYFDGTDWQDSWDSTSVNNSLPTAIEVTLEINRSTTPGNNNATTATDTLRTVRIIALPCYANTTSDTPTPPTPPSP